MILLAKTTESQVSAYNETKVIWKEVMPDTPYEGFFQKEIYLNFLFLMDGHTKVLIFVTLIFIILSCSSLFGLLSFKMASKLKDFSIMKIMGANAFQLFKKLIAQFLIFLTVGILIGWPVSLYLANKLFKIVYITHIPINILIPLYSSILIVLLFLITSTIFIIRIIKHNPIESIRNN